MLVVSLPAVSGKIAAADLNQDGKLDLVVALPHGGYNGSAAGFAVLLGNGNGTFQTPRLHFQPLFVSGLAVGHLTGCHSPCIVVSDGSSAYLYYGNGAGGFARLQTVALPGSSAIAIGDVNGDGFPDLVSSGGYVAFGTPFGTFTQPVSYPIEDAEGTRSVVLADLRNNGRTDIVIDSY